jgi:hypothetical protein
MGPPDVGESHVSGRPVPPLTYNELPGKNKSPRHVPTGGAGNASSLLAFSEDFGDAK